MSLLVAVMQIYHSHGTSGGTIIWILRPDFLWNALHFIFLVEQMGITSVQLGIRSKQEK